MSEVQVTLGVDSHRDMNVAVALDQQGRMLGTRAVPTTRQGHSELLRWATNLGELTQVGVEGSSSYGAGLCRILRSQGILVLEVERPHRRSRRVAGKSDPLDAEKAARAVLAGEVRVVAKGGDGDVENLRMLWVTRAGAMKARTQAANQLHALVVTSPDRFKECLGSLSTKGLIRIAARWRPDPRRGRESVAKFAMRSVARRYLELDLEISSLDTEIQALVDAAAPALIATKGIGYETAAALLVAAGDNPERLRTESAFAHLCGAAPVPASSGKTVRHRLSRGGDRQANRALFLIVLGRMRLDERTRNYVRRRTGEGLSKMEIIRCLKRYVAREVYPLLPRAAT